MSAQLALDERLPMQARNLEELGIDAPQASCRLAHSAPFRLLDDDDLEQVRAAIARQAHAARSSTVGAAILPDLALREPWVREHVLAPAFLERIAPHVPIPVRIHPMGTNLAHVNLQRPGADVFDWHTDSSPLSVVTMLSDVPDGDGATEIRDGSGQVHMLSYPGPGWAVVIHGSVVPHRARPTRWPERITMVTSLLPVDLFVRDTKNLDLALLYTDPALVGTDYLKHRLERLLAQAADLQNDPSDLASVGAKLALIRVELDDTLRTLAAVQERLT